MVGALFVVSAPVVDSPPCPSLCFDSSPVTKTSLRSGGDLVLQRKSKAKSHLAVSKSVDLRSSFVNSGGEWRRLANGGHRSWRNQRRNRRLVVVNEFAGQYEDSFDDVKMFGSWRNVDPVVGGTRALNQIRPLEIAMKNVQEQSKMYSPSTL